ncbi:MAG: LamG-like jellyroll fold domain-containing protein [Ignavibacteriaceae bacterium]
MIFIRPYILLYFLLITEMCAQQINIPRVELMPREPSPYLMRNWDEAARGYDSLVFNEDLTGEYLPLIWFYNNTINYREHGSFGLHTVVGTPYPESVEAINILPAVIGASLIGIDKSNQDGKNYVLMCEEFFNKRAEENIYLNNPATSSGDDWWYETMPNVFFYQLYDLYRGTGDFAYQFKTIAGRWLESVLKMGGSSTPWNLPYMNYRAWSLSTMTPNNTGVKEPEASGAIAWILYNAYVETGEEKYRIGAEWCLEYLNSLASNPSYELQLPYGVLTAARMNAELGTNYNTQKLINWCFEIGSLRKWGAIVGTWNGYDVSGLIGESDDNDYAFVMNTFEHAGALVPLVRYDDRFARAIGKWMLNAANAARLFYTKYLPAENQDSYEWSAQYDPNSYIAHEALREDEDGISPFATGDAIAGGWGETNLALYGSSHAGIFGGIIDTTNVEKILKLDLNRTDYFAKLSYPSFLFYNPYDQVKSVELNIGTGVYDIYDAVSNSFVKNNVSGNAIIDIPADDALIAVIIPSGGMISYDLNKMFVNGIVVDFNIGASILNHSPRIKSLSAVKEIILISDSVAIYCSAADKDNNVLSYSWSTEQGIIKAYHSWAMFTAPPYPGEYSVICEVNDGNGGITSDTIIIDVREIINHAPQISLKADPKKIDINSSCELQCIAIDQDGDSLTISWSASAGTFTTGDSVVRWHSPSLPGNYYITCSVSDGMMITSDSVLVVVRDFSDVQTGSLLLDLPFTGNADDQSGNGNVTTVFQASLTADRFNNPGNAFLFDGNNDYIQVSNTPQLNFQNSISINLWIKVNSFYEREAYPISHGNWENRWKISVTNNKIRWTVNTNSGIKDLDSETELQSDSLYNITVVYSEPDMEIYINGKLDAYTPHSGSINQTSYDLMIGQVLPDNYNFGFNGVLDDIKIYDYALSMDKIKALYDISTDVNTITEQPIQYFLEQNYPNPFNPVTKILYSVGNTFSNQGGRTHISIKVFDILGKEIATLVNRESEPGRYEVKFDASDLPSGIYFYRLTTSEYSETKKMILLR